MRESRDGWWLLITILLAVALFGMVTALLLSLDPKTSGAEAVRDGRAGVRGGRRPVRPVAQRPSATSGGISSRAGTEEPRAGSGARGRRAVARAVELLGHEADQVRVGALHALAGLARSRPSYVQTVLDVVCSYLRRPFDHPDYVRDRTGERPQWAPADERDADRERQVRLAAQRVISELVPDRHRRPDTLPDLDLTGAVLDYLDLSGKAIHELVLRDTQLHGTNRFSATEISGDVWFTRAASYGRLKCDGVIFCGGGNFHHVIAHDRVSFEGAHFRQGAVFLSSEFHGPVTLAGSTFDKSVDLRRTVFRDDLDLRSRLPYPVRPGTGGMTVNASRDIRLPDGWMVRDDGRLGRIDGPEAQL